MMLVTESFEYRDEEKVRMRLWKQRDHLLTFGIDNSGTLSAIHCTIAFNDSGVHNSGTFVAQDTLIANNTNGSAVEGLTPCDFFGVLTCQGFNLIGNLTNTTVIGDTTGNIYGVDPVLGPLQDNGGPTWTHALSPAHCINAR